MRKILKKASLALVLSLAVAAMTPAAKSSMAASNVKTFTYAEQLSGRKVTEAQMDVGEKLDLRFIGVSDYTNYDWSWTSSNESVAVVDRGGVITALSEGVTRIRLVVGDESKYTSDGVIAPGIETIPASTVARITFSFVFGDTMNCAPAFFASSTISSDVTVPFRMPSYHPILPQAFSLYQMFCEETPVCSGQM